MLLSKLEQLALRAARLADCPGDAGDLRDISEQLNEGLQALMLDMANQQQRFAERLSTRIQLQAAIGFGEGAPSSARKMHAADQQAFYNQLLGEMLQFITGSDQGRCVSFELSVEELLFFIRLLLEEKIMDVGALKFIFLFLSRHARTPGSEMLSYESLRKKYSGVQLGAKRRVGELLANLMRRVERHIEAE